ncbi:putative HAT dimerization domain, ribonuclease H-like superfamily [Helianthus annuus]|nr:putative HAT dimerization domain, ribonuclease H-like superfamily [Helianthus annuus]
MMLEAAGQFGRGAPPPTRYQIGETYLKKEVERIHKLLTPYKDEWKSNGCSIMTDAWSDRKRRSIMNFCVNSKSGTIFLSSKESSDESHTSEHIYEYVEACIKEVGPENVVQVVTDNASNNMGAAKLLKEKRPTIFWTSCATHTLNLMLEGIGGLSRYNKILTQAKALTVFIYAHHKTLALMRHFTKKRDIVRPGVTRFASAFLTLQSLADKKAQLKQMFTSDEWEACKFRKSTKGKVAHSTVMNIPFWTGVALCLKVFTPLVKVLRMVDADRKPSMGFIYGEIESAKQEIMNVLGNKEKYYQPVLDIISKKMKGRLDTKLHLTAYLLNPYYLYNNPDMQNDLDLSDAIVEFIATIYPGNHTLQNHIMTVELPVYKSKQEKFSREMATKGCLVNDDNFDPANWWGAYGASTPELTKIAIRILSLTTSSSGCERNWSTFEGVHTKKRNRLETNKLNNLVFVQFNANLMQMNKKRKTKGMEVLLANDASEAQDWIVEGDVEEAQPEVPSAASINGESLENRRSSRLRELEEEDFVSENEEELSDEVEYESDGVNINEQYGDPLENILEEDD